MKRLIHLRFLPLIAALAALPACRPHSGSGPLLPSAKVTVAFPQAGMITNWDQFPAHLDAVESVELRPRVAGYIQSIHFEDGAEVRAGDLLVVIDPKPYQADLDKAAAERLRSATRLELTRNDLQRVESLRGTKAISEEEYDTRRNAVREAEAALTAAQAAESAARINLDYTQIKAPVSGRIGRRLVTPGNLVQGGGMVPGTILATLVTLDPIYCYFDADESAFQRYRAKGIREPRDTALACELGLVNEEGFPHRGHIDFFDNTLNGKTGTLRIRGIFPNPDRALLPGMFARVRVPAGPPTPALLIPAVAVGSDQGRSYVLLANSNNVVELRPIRADRQQGALRPVLSGLDAKDRVIVNGLMRARPGSKVEIEAAPAATAGAAPGTAGGTAANDASR